MITREEIENIARLAKLSVEESDTESLTQDLEKMMEFAQAVSCADMGDISIYDTQEFTPLREDAVKVSLPADDVLLNAPSTSFGYFTVEKNG